MKICTIIGARPQFIKAAALSAKIASALEKGLPIEEIIIHTGQHYDTEMSEIFFKDLGIPREKYNLNVGSASHAVQTAKILTPLEKILLYESPDIVLTYGDTNSTLAAAITASKLKIKIAHVEAGMRSFNKNMPEEINRIVVDHLADINFCPTKTAVENIKREGLAKTAKLVGDIMFDTSLIFAKQAEKITDQLLRDFEVENKKFILMTCHRAENTDTPERLSEIISAANEISKNMKIIFPLHPRTKKILEKLKVEISKNIHICQPLGYLQTIALEKNAKLLITDSGGMQKEAFFFQTPCITTRDETEWVETVQTKMNILAGANRKKIISAFANFAKTKKITKLPSPYGKGNTSEKIIEILLDYAKSKK